MFHSEIFSWRLRLSGSPWNRSTTPAGTIAAAGSPLGGGSDGKVPFAWERRRPSAPANAIRQPL
jgi:hypothetical protein